MKKWTKFSELSTHEEYYSETFIDKLMKILWTVFYKNPRGPNIIDYVLVFLVVAMLINSKYIYSLPIKLILFSLYCF